MQVELMVTNPDLYQIAKGIYTIDKELVDDFVITVDGIKCIVNKKHFKPNLIGRKIRMKVDYAEGAEGVQVGDIFTITRATSDGIVIVDSGRGHDDTWQFTKAVYDFVDELTPPPTLDSDISSFKFTYVTTIKSLMNKAAELGFESLSEKDATLVMSKLNKKSTELLNELNDFLYDSDYGFVHQIISEHTKLKSIPIPDVYEYNDDDEDEID